MLATSAMDVHTHPIYYLEIKSHITIQDFENLSSYDFSDASDKLVNCKSSKFTQRRYRYSEKIRIIDSATKEVVSMLENF